MTKFKIYAGLKRPYAPLHLVDEKEFLTNREAKWYARECARKIYRDHEPYDSALVTKEEIREHPTDFGIYPLKEEDFLSLMLSLSICTQWIIGCFLMWNFNYSY